MLVCFQSLSFLVLFPPERSLTIYGSITNIQIAEALEKLGHNIDRKIIVVKNQVKELGKYEAIVKLHKEVSAVIPFEVVAEAEPEAEVEATPAE